MEEWKETFKLIYKRPPVANDASIAPENLRKEFLASFGKDIEPVKPATLKPEKRGVKRKNVGLRRPEEETMSPPHKRNAPTSSLKTPERRGCMSPLKTPSRTSPRKKVTFPELSLDDDVETIPRTPRVLSERRIRRMVEFDMSPLKPLSSEKKNTLTPIKSPRKMSVKRNICSKSLSSLLLPTPDKSQKEEENEENVPEFDDETNEDVVAAKAMKPKTEGVKKVKEKPNFIKINLRKKTFVRGKVTAEQKRKLKRKQMYRKRFGK